MTPCASAEMRLACGAGRGCRCAVRARHAGEAIGLRQQIEYGWNDQRAGDDTDDQRHLLTPWRGADELAGFEILQIVVRDRGDREDDGGGKEGERRQRQLQCGRRMDHNAEQCRANQDRENADAGDGAVRRTDQARHVAADRSDQKSAEEDVRQRSDGEQARLRLQRRRIGELIDEQGREREAGDRQRDHDRRRKVLVARIAVAAGARRTKVTIRPCTSGPASFASDQTAATAIAPAPMKRT